MNELDFLKMISKPKIYQNNNRQESNTTKSPKINYLSAKFIKFVKKTIFIIFRF